MKGKRAAFPLGAGAVFVAIAATTHAADTAPLAGTWRCEGHQNVCGWSGTTFTVTQDGSHLTITNEKGESGRGKISADRFLSLGATWNMLGVVHATEEGVIDWSNGTRWRKQ
jgi:hypothetical protein